MEEKKISEKESLEIITEMISRTKERYIGDGNIMLLWGYLSVGIAALVWIMLVLTRNPMWNWLWFAIGVIDVAISGSTNSQIVVSAAQNRSNTTIFQYFR